MLSPRSARAENKKASPSPKGFSQAKGLLDNYQNLWSQTFALQAELLPNDSLQPIIQSALQFLDPQTFAMRFQTKALKENASYTQLKLPFINWCLGKPEQAQRKEEAEQFWSYCQKLLPAPFYDGLRFGQADEQIRKVRAHLNAKADLSEKVDRG